MKDTLLIRCESGLKELIDWYADEVNTNRSNVVRMILYHYIKSKKAELDSVREGVFRDDNKTIHSSMVF